MWLATWAACSRVRRITELAPPLWINHHPNPRVLSLRWYVNLFLQTSTWETITVRIGLFKTDKKKQTCQPGADLENWGPQANIGTGGPIHLHKLPRSTLRFLFCHDASCCTMVPHSCVQCFYMLHVIMGFFHLHLFIHLTVTFILSCCRPRNSNCFTVEIQVLTKTK